MNNSNPEPSYLDRLVADARRLVEADYYYYHPDLDYHPVSLRQAIRNSVQIPIITEIKFASPSKGTIREGKGVPDIASKMVRGGATALSVLTEPKHFNGHLDYLYEARKSVTVPILMKDFVINPIQLSAAKAAGADAVLLIMEAYEDGRTPHSLETMITEAHTLHLEVLLETHTLEGFQKGLETNADLLGINNRDLRTMKVDLDTTRRILQAVPKTGKTVVSESGYQEPTQIQQFRKLGVDAFLIGSSIMASEDVEAKVRSLVNAEP